MLECLKDLPPGIVGVKASGTVTTKEYEQTVVPMLDEARAQGQRLRFIYQVAEDFEGFTPSDGWEDVRLGLRATRLFDGCAALTDIGWIRESTPLVGFFLPCPVRAFGADEMAEAVEWLGTLSDTTGITHHLVPGSGIIVVEANAAASAQAWDALAFSADAWIEAHGALQGLIFHAREFPGWTDFGSLLRHVRFIRDHHQKIGRVALVSDSELSNVAPRVAEHFLSAEIEGFPYDEMEDAIAWVHAGASVEPRAVATMPG
jgi:hypothetical protein